MATELDFPVLLNDLNSNFNSFLKSVIKKVFIKIINKSIYSISGEKKLFYHHNSDYDTDYAKISFKVKTIQSNNLISSHGCNSLTESINSSSDQFSATSTADSSCSVVFDFLQEFIYEHLNFSNTTANPLTVTDYSCVTTTNSFSLAYSKDITPLYSTHNPIFSTTPNCTSPVALSNPNLPNEDCLPRFVSKFRLEFSSYMFRNVSVNLEMISKVRSSKCSGQQFSANQNTYYRKNTSPNHLKPILQHFLLSDFQEKYGISSSMVSKLPIDLKFWTPRIFKFCFPSNSLPHLPRFITISLRDNTGQNSQQNVTPFDQKSNTSVIELGPYEIPTYLIKITLKFLNYEPLNVVFSPFTILDTAHIVVICYDSDKVHLEDCEKHCSA